MCAYHGVRNVSFSENFATILNEFSVKDTDVHTCFLIVTSDFEYVFAISAKTWKLKRKFTELFIFQLLAGCILWFLREISRTAVLKKSRNVYISSIIAVNN